MRMGGPFKDFGQEITSFKDFGRKKGKKKSHFSISVLSVKYEKTKNLHRYAKRLGKKTCTISKNFRGVYRDILPLLFDDFLKN